MAIKIEKVRFMKKIIISGLFLFSIYGCGHSGSNSNDGGIVPSPSVANTVSFSRGGVVPVFGAGTSTVVYIHNDQNVPLNNLQYSVVTNTTNLQKKNTTAGVVAKSAQDATNTSLVLNDPTACSTISANGSCALSFTTPGLTVGQTGSAIIQAAYTVNGVTKTIDTVVSYAYANSKMNSGQVLLYPPSSVFGSQLAHGTIYVAGVGPSSGAIKTTNISVTNGGKIVAGYTSGQSVMVGQVLALDVSAPVAANTYQVALTAVLSNGFVTTSGFSIMPEIDTAYLLSSVSPVIPVGNSVPGTGSVSIENVGNLDTTAISAVSSNPDLSVSGCSSVLSPAQACSLDLSVNTESSGSATLSVSYGGTSSLSIPVQWYNAGGTVVLISPSQRNLIMYGGESANSTITVSNPGSYTIKGFNLTQVIKAESGTAPVGSLLGASNTCASVTNFAPGDSCTAVLNIAAQAFNIGGIGLSKLDVSGTSDESSTAFDARSYVVYTVLPISPVLVFNPPAVSATINGNQIESNITTMQVLNSGNTTASMSGFNLSTAPAYLNKTDACSSMSGGLLHAGESCIVSFKLGPTYLKPATPESGVAQYSILYTGGTVVTPESGNYYESYMVLPANIDLNISNITVSGGSGDAISGFTFLGSNSTAKTITITYTNESAAAGGTILNNVYVDFNSNGLNTYFWQVSSSTCGNVDNAVGGVTLQPNTSCNVVLTNQLANYPSYVGSQGTVNSTFNLPQVTLKDESNNFYRFTPQYNSSTSVPSSNKQVTVDSVLSYNASTESVTLIQSYNPTTDSGWNGSLTVNSSWVTSSSQGVPSLATSSGSPSCSLNAYSSADNISCTFSGQTAASVTYYYPIEPLLIPGFDTQVYQLVGIAAGALVGYNNVNTITEN